jgi:hypothetical protein
MNAMPSRNDSLHPSIDSHIKSITIGITTQHKQYLSFLMYEFPLHNGWLRIQGNDLHTFLGGHGIFLHTALHQQAMEHHSLQYLSILLLSILAIFVITSAYLLTHFFNDHDHEPAGKLRLWVGMERACPFFICFCFCAKMRRYHSFLLHGERDTRTRTQQYLARVCS